MQGERSERGWDVVYTCGCPENSYNGQGPRYDCLYGVVQQGGVVKRVLRSIPTGTGERRTGRRGSFHEEGELDGLLSRIMNAGASSRLPDENPGDPPGVCHGENRKPAAHFFAYDVKPALEPSGPRGSWSLSLSSKMQQVWAGPWLFGLL